MPIYNFKCTKCGHSFDKLLIMSGRDLAAINDGTMWPICGKCGGRTEKGLSAANFRVNGHNYKNGYAKGQA
jgi:putative FmdB family regulatory protein